MSVQNALEQPAVISNSFRDSYYPHAVLGKRFMLCDGQSGGSPPAL